MRVWLWTLFSLLFFMDCSSYERFRQVTEGFEYQSRIYPFNRDQVWLAVTAVTKKFDILEKFQDRGSLKTQWMDNTESYNFINVLDFGQKARRAQFQLQMSVVQGFQHGQEMTKVMIYRRQLIERGQLQGLEEVPSDGISERILLHRIHRVLQIEKYFFDLQKKREKALIKSFDNSL